MSAMTIKRVTETEHGTFGVLIEHMTPIAVTIELPWKNNIPYESCIPVNTYACEKVLRADTSVAIGGASHTYEILEVPNRTKIMFHIANTIDDLKGCVGVGSQYGELTGKTAVLASRVAFESFIKRLNGITRFPLTILNA